MWRHLVADSCFLTHGDGPQVTDRLNAGAMLEDCCLQSMVPALARSWCEPRQDLPPKASPVLLPPPPVVTDWSGGTWPAIPKRLQHGEREVIHSCQGQSNLSKGPGDANPALQGTPAAGTPGPRKLPTSARLFG
ncbi:hypothetical protein CK820_G0040786 [Pan troglodytes]|uniref:Uncharacterized protein n=1 Tax=Pan troglodytes TaxID=9598 RepID=A0A2J8Q939_PANTR|nr:hypothetical protein CK820_G0040786 [Pan troglodytes]